MTTAGRDSISPTPATSPSAGVRSISSCLSRRRSWAAKISGPYSTNVPGSTRSSRFSRAVRCPRSWRLATASGRAASSPMRVAVADRGEVLARLASRSARAGSPRRRRRGRLGRHREPPAAGPRHRVADGDVDPAHDAVPLGDHLVLHLHRLEHDHRGAGRRPARRAGGRPRSRSPSNGASTSSCCGSGIGAELVSPAAHRLEDLLGRGVVAGVLRHVRPGDGPVGRDQHRPAELRGVADRLGLDAAGFRGRRERLGDDLGAEQLAERGRPSRRRPCSWRGARRRARPARSPGGGESAPRGAGSAGRSAPG